MSNKFLDYEGLQRYHSKITNFIETRPVNAEQAVFGGGLKVLFDLNFEEDPHVNEVQYWDKNDQIREVNCGSQLYEKDGTYINITSTLGTTLKDLEALHTGDSFTFKVGNETFTETVTEFDYYMEHSYRVNVGTFVVSWPRENEGSISLRFWPVEAGCAVLNASTSVEFVSINASSSIKDYIANESSKTKESAVEEALSKVENKWFQKTTIAKGLSELDWCLFEPQYSNKVVMAYKNDPDGDAEDVDIFWR